MRFATGARENEILPNANWSTGSGRVMANPNLQLLTDAAKLFEPILGELVFLGGCATALLITDTAAADVRPTLCRKNYKQSSFTHFACSPRLEITFTPVSIVMLLAKIGVSKRHNRCSASTAL